jgi:hypothetical protein
MDTQQQNQSRKDQNAIRYYKGSVAKFKQMFDDLADGKDTNAYDSPVRQGYDIHPTRKEDITSDHWKEVDSPTNENHITNFKNFK